MKQNLINPKKKKKTKPIILESVASRKEKLLQRKMRKPNFEMIQKAKLLWEIVRQKEIKQEERQPKLDELFETVKGTLRDVCQNKSTKNKKKN